MYNDFNTANRTVTTFQVKILLRIQMTTYMNSTTSTWNCAFRIFCVVLLILSMSYEANKHINTNNPFLLYVKVHILKQCKKVGKKSKQA